MKVNPSTGFSIVCGNRTIEVPGALCAAIAALPEVAALRRREGDNELSTKIVEHICQTANIVKTQTNYWEALEAAIRAQTPRK